MISGASWYTELPTVSKPSPFCLYARGTETVFWGITAMPSIMRLRRSFCGSHVGFPPEFRVTVYIWKWCGIFFHYHYGKGSRNPEFWNDFFSVNQKFPECCSGFLDRYGIPERSGILFRKNRSGNFQNNWYQN